MILRLQHLKPSYLQAAHLNASDVWLKNIQISENTLITAPSGTGKTSLFNILYLKQAQYDGELHIDDTNASNFKDEAIASYRKEKISAVFQDLKLFDELSLLENIQIKNDLTHYYDLDQIKLLIDQLGLSPQTHQKVATLSFGQKQRTAIIRALCQPFEYLLLDEPFSHLDQENIHLIRNLILEELAKRSAKMILLSLEEDYGFPFEKRLHL